MPTRAQVQFWGCLGVLFVASMWIRSAFPITALGDAIHDDLLFLELAEHMGKFRWLGPYDEFTMAKGAFYSFFILLCHAIHLPLKLGEQAFYLGSALLFSLTAGRLWASRWAGVACFAVLSLNPLPWAAPVGGRVVREGIYSSLSMLLLALALRVWIERASPDPAQDFRTKRRALVALGLAGAAFWLTREEGLWLAPALAIPAAYFAWHGWHDLRRGAPPLAIAGPLVLPVLVFAAAVGAVNATNWFVYGVFKNNDFRSHDFQAAYGALSRISHDREQPYVLFPKDARLRAYSVSPAAAELRPFFEGAGGAAWARMSCEQRNRTGCAEIEAGLLMWALRQSVTEAGHYRSATEARSFYLRLAREVNDACDQKRIPCGAARATMVPPWRPEYLEQTLSAARDVVLTLVKLTDGQPHALGSVGTPEHIAFFRKMTAGRIATETVRDARNVRQHVATAAFYTEIWLLPFVLPASIVAWVAIGLWRPRLLVSPGGIVVAMLLAALAMRVALLSFLDATSMPAANILYLSPAVPMLLALAPCVAAWAWKVRHRT